MSIRPRSLCCYPKRSAANRIASSLGGTDQSDRGPYMAARCAGGNGSDRSDTRSSRGPSGLRSVQNFQFARTTYELCGPPASSGRNAPSCSRGLHHSGSRGCQGVSPASCAAGFRLLSPNPAPALSIQAIRPNGASSDALPLARVSVQRRIRFLMVSGRVVEPITSEPVERGFQ